MAKRSDIKKLKSKKKNSVPINARKVSVQYQDLEETPLPDDAFDSLQDESFPLMDTDNIKRSSAVTDKTKRSGLPKAEKRFKSRRAGFLNKFSGIFEKITAAVSSVFGKKRSTNAALEFAVNHKRRSKREKRRRMIIIFGGAGFSVTAVAVLAVLLINGGASAPAGPVPTIQQAVAADNMIDTQSYTQLRASGAKMPVLMTFSAAFSDDEFDYIPTDDTVNTTSDPLLTESNPAVTESNPAVTESNPAVTTTAPTPPIETTVPDPTPAPIIVEDLIDYYIVEEGPYYNDMGYSTNHYKYTNQEFTDFAAMLYYEARGEGMTGMVAVGNVIMNRVLCRSAFPDNITSVLSARGQFTPWDNYQKKGTPSGTYWSRAKRAARAVLDKELWVIPQDVYYFKRGSAAGSNVFYKKIGNHNFFRHSYRGRQRGGGVPPALYDRNYKYPQYGCKPAKRVYRVQYMLNKLGYDVKADSYFGITTKEALIEFQKKHKLKADGIAGPATVKKLIKKFGAENYYDKFLR